MIDILVPVLGRPHNAQPLVDSAKVTQNPYRLVFICSPHDSEQIAASKATGADVLVVEWQPGSGDYAKKINHAFRETDSEWIFTGADDIRFTAEWDTRAVSFGIRKRKRVIGTNDLHNPSVKMRQGSTHTLIARSYIKRYGGTEDGTGEVLCELYDHQYVDAELIEVARRRGEWLSCPTSVVEHFHPHWGNAESDPTYVKALRRSNADRRLYFQRMGRGRRSVKKPREKMQGRRSRW